ncbi:TPA: hypothetical protein EYP38_00845 [Candidatus Micrarchaeota archaeon]|nr:hypothetical protein [Candidatus Micrarchaeota archaeon]
MESNRLCSFSLIQAMFVMTRASMRTNISGMSHREDSIMPSVMGTKSMNPFMARRGHGNNTDNSRKIPKTSNSIEMRSSLSM